MRIAVVGSEAKDGDALRILTDWQDFANLDLERLRSSLSYPIIVDGRNLYQPAIMSCYAFLYYSVGRPDAQPRRPAGKSERLAALAFGKVV